MIKIRNDGLHTVEQAPGAKIDYGVNWTTELKAGEIILSSTWTSDNGNLFSREQNLAGVTAAFVGLPKKLDGKTVTVINSIITNLGREDSRVLLIVCTPQ